MTKMIYYHCLMFTWMLLNLWVARRYDTYNIYNVAICISTLLVINPIQFYLSPRIGFIEKRKSFLYVYPLTTLYILILGPFVFGYFLWPDYLFWVRVREPLSVFDTVYMLSCLIVYFLTLFFYSKRTKQKK
jgi:Ca2+/Na+ antiporter